MSGEIWFTSDHHFGHKSIIKFSKRPYATADDMDKDLISKWNSRVSHKDRVYHLGDFSFRNSGNTHGIISALNGSICLVRGNHDEKRIKGDLIKRFEWVKYQYFLKLDKKTQIMMNHCAMLTWWNSHYGAYMLHGHSHGCLEDSKNGPLRMDVGVDTHNMYPYNLDEIRTYMASRRVHTVDHHKQRGP